MFFEQSNNLVKIETVFFQFRATNENIQYDIRKQCNFIQLKDTHTHTKKTTNIYTQTHRKNYTMTHTNNLPKHKTKLSHMLKSMVPIHKERVSVLSQQLQFALK